MEELPRLLVCYNRCEFDFLLATENLFLNSVLSHIGIEAELLPVTAISHYQADNLLVPSYLAPTGLPSRGTVKILSKFGATYATDDGQCRPERLYISRRKAARRRVANEERLIALLEPLGFHVVELESMGLHDQIRTFRAARMVVAPHGAGLANLAFCQPGCQIIELFNNGYVHNCFAQLTQLIDGQYCGLCSQPNRAVEHGVKASQADITVDFDEVVAWVERLSCE